jgi:hypothetical protein
MVVRWIDRRGILQLRDPDAPKGGARKIVGALRSFAEQGKQDDGLVA